MPKQLANDLTGRVVSPTNWDLILNGQPWECVQGEDFNGSVDSFKTAVYKKAKERNRHVTINTVYDEKDGKVSQTRCAVQAKDEIVPTHKTFGYDEHGDIVSDMDFDSLINKYGQLHGPFASEVEAKASRDILFDK